jgi:hypothetical protein
MESYIIRVYRRSDEAGHEVSGLVERVGNGGRQAFSSGEDLWRFIAGKSAEATKRARTRGYRAEKGRGR